MGVKHTKDQWTRALRNAIRACVANCRRASLAPRPLEGNNSTGPSRSDVSVTVQKLGRLKVRVTSDYAKIGSHDIELTRVGDSITNVDGDTLFTVDTSNMPHTIGLNPAHGACVYRR
jgi:hypothetical protein